MAKNLNSATFTVLLFVLVLASTGIFKSEALPGVTCPLETGCSATTSRVFLSECGEAPFKGTDVDCCNCCKKINASPPLCWAVVEGLDLHCHCYQKAP
ncbi:unnamed protein product [Eruca vesicaria subsp. sativa]|uniref:Uncharacterized protein n=1 Tax=Eruca vesicaria subsp. sativa TaxID=29727 RepID=A0ABC8KKT2_ERUVS|nr:unnamed protein product [Eruca vesicaria subsp. sativa]